MFNRIALFELRYQFRNVKPREGMPSPQLSEVEFKRRYLSQFVDPEFRTINEELDKVAAIAWTAYDDGRKSPITNRGPRYANPDYELCCDPAENTHNGRRAIHAVMSHCVSYKISVRSQEPFNGNHVAQ